MRSEGEGPGLGAMGRGCFQHEEGRQGQAMEGSKSKEDSRGKGACVCAERHLHFWEEQALAFFEGFSILKKKNHAMPKGL